MHAQLGAWDVQIVADGRATSRSSSVPARTKTRWGLDSAALNTWVPQSGQKRRCMVLPLSATLKKSRSSPSTLTAALGKHTLTVPLPDPRYWQSRHQHTRVMMGSAEIR